VAIHPYSGELAAIAHALNILPDVSHRRIELLTTNKAVALSFRNPRQQSGQVYLRRTYTSLSKLWRYGNGLLVFWIPSSNENELLQLAKREALYPNMSEKQRKRRRLRCFGHIVNGQPVRSGFPHWKGRCESF
jgi:hypothetical protein